MELVMAWFRVYPDITHDPKLSNAAAELEIPYAQVLGYWIAFLSLANDSPERGKLMASAGKGLANLTVAETLHIAPEELPRVVRVFIDNDLLTNYGGNLGIVHWDKRQFVSDDATGRSREWRKKKPATTLQRCKNIACNDIATDQTTDNRVQSTDTEAETEQTSRDVDPVSLVLREWDRLTGLVPHVGLDQRETIAAVIKATSLDRTQAHLRQLVHKHSPKSMKYILAVWAKELPPPIPGEVTPEPPRPKKVPMTAEEQKAALASFNEKKRKLMEAQV
jgi:hypothetical protein